MINRIILVFIVPVLLFAHSGRTDANGGHYNRKTGEYHYHNSGYTKSYSNTNTVTRKTSTYFIQSSLKLLGYYSGTIDGIWGSGTSSAIKMFQVVEGLTATGTFNNETKLALLKKMESKTF